MKVLIRSFGLTLIGILLSIAILNFTMIDTRENELLYATNNSINQTQIIVAEVLQDEAYKQKNSRLNSIPASEIYDLMGKTTGPYPPAGTSAAQYLKDSRFNATIEEKNNFYKNVFTKFFKSQVTSDSVFDITFNAVDFDKGLLDVTIENTFVPILYSGNACKYNDVAPGCKTILIHRTNIIDQLEPVKHTYDIITTIEEGSCAKEKIIEKTCSVCGEKIIVNLGLQRDKHENIELIGGIEPTCTTPGYSAEKRCTRCDTVIEKGKEIAPLGHDMTGEWVLDPVTLDYVLECNRHCGHKLVQSALDAEMYKNATFSIEGEPFTMSDLSSITISNQLIPTNLNLDLTVVDLNQNGTVKAVINPYGEAVIYNTVKPGKVMAPKDCSMLFAYHIAEVLDLKNLDTSNTTTMAGMFKKMGSEDSLMLNVLSTVNPKISNYAYNYTIIDVSGFNTSNVTDMSEMFSGNTDVQILDVSGFNTSQVTNMAGMFVNCNSLTSLNLSSFNTSQVNDMSSMFDSCRNLESLDLSNFNTSEVTNMRYMFSGCRSLTSLDVSSFNTSKVTNMKYMFSGCKSLTSLDLSNFNTSQVNEMYYMFYNCYNLATLNIANFDTTLCWIYDEYDGGDVFEYNPNLSKVTTGNKTEIYLPQTKGSVWLTSAGQEIAVGDICFRADTYTRNKIQLELNKNMYKNSGINNLSGSIVFSDQLFPNNPDGKVVSLNENDTVKGVIKGEDVVIYNTITAGKIKAPTDCSYLFEEKFGNSVPHHTSIDLSNFDTSETTNMRGMFEECYSLTSINMSGINTENVVDMSAMFYRCFSLTSLDLSSFNTSKVANMSWMFNDCHKLSTLNISSFNTVSVTNMSFMFFDCNSLTSLNVTNFNTWWVTNMENMFSSCYNLTSLDLSNFNTSRVTSMKSMFNSCNSLTSLDLSNFNTSRVTSMSSMFNGCDSLASINTSSFNTLNVKDMSGMFRMCDSLTSLDLSNFNTSNVTDMSDMFESDDNLVSLDISNFNSFKAQTSYMFNLTKKLERINTSGNITFDIPSASGHWYGTDYNEYTPNQIRRRKDTYIANLPLFYQLPLDDVAYKNSKLKTLSGSISFSDQLLPSTATGEIISLNRNNSVQAVINGQNAIIYNTVEPGKVMAPVNCYGLFQNHAATSMDLRNLDTGNVTSMGSMFDGCKSLTSLDLSNFNTSLVTNMSNMFGNCQSLTSLDLSNFNTSLVTNMSNMFGNCQSLTSLDLSNFNTSQVSNMTKMFSECYKLKSLNVSSFNTSKVTNMYYMFYNCLSLTSLDLSNFNTSLVTNMSNMFRYCQSLTSLDLSNFNTSQVSNMSNMFTDCNKLTNLNISSFNTINVTNMSWMFNGCRKLTILNTANFNTSQVTNMKGMFFDCNSLTSLNVTGFNTSKVTNMRYMFSGCKSLTSLDLSSFNTSQVIDMCEMFESCNSLASLNLSNKFVRQASTDVTDMFTGCNKLNPIPTIPVV